MIRSLILLILILLPLSSCAEHKSLHASPFDHNSISRLDSPAGQDWSEASNRSNEWWERYNDRQIARDKYCEESRIDGILRWRTKTRDSWRHLKDKKLDAVVQIHVRVKDAILDNAERNLSTKENAGTDWMEMKVLHSDVQDHELGYTSGNVRHIDKAVDLLATAIYLCSSSFKIQRLNHIRMDLEDTIFDEPVEDVHDIWKIAYRYDGATGRVSVTTLPYYCKN